ncbi:MAG: HupE/UreJ family protein, partial [Pseudomonadota bacterium]
MLMLAAEASAHEVRPAYLEITETAPSTFDVVWKQPLRGGERLKIDPVLPEACVPEGERRSIVAGVLVHRWQVQCDLRDGALRVDGLDRTLTDVFVRIEREGEATLTAVLRAANDTVSLAPGEGAPGVSAYFRIGVEHILEGYDHLLFVFGLMLLVRLRQLIPAITAFTLAHSITLGASAMAGISLPGPPVEITIALSIAFLASEAIGRQRGRETLAVRRPWTVAFGIGLVHGFGFAGALSEIGLPEGARLMALLLFNL